jgi:lauroyl/myristoyl acyltransferase
MILLLARSMGRTGWAVSGRDRRVALANLALAFPGQPSGWRRHVAMRSFETFALTLLDVAWFSRGASERLDRWVALDSSVTPAALPAQVIGLTGHYGNWELISRAMVHHGMPLAAVAAPLANPAVDRIFHRVREEARVDIIWKKGALRGILKAVRQGRHVAFVMDQNVLPEDGGVFVPFFGFPALFSTAPAGLMAKTGLPAVTVFCTANDAGFYRIHASPPFHADPAADRVVLTRQITETFERQIAERPEPWLWMYKRWKYLPPGRDRDGFPFYAKALPGHPPAGARNASAGP